MKLVGALVALITGQGWQWVRVLEDRNLLPAGSGVPVALFLAAAFVLNQLLLALPVPAPRSVVRDRSAAVDLLLRGLLSEYYRNLEAAPHDSAPQPIVRCNVMLPVRWKFGWNRFVQIAYKACPTAVVEYTPEEIELRWMKSDGVVGWVWRTGNEHTYSRALSDGAKSVAERLTNEQRIAVSALRSVYSVPILKDGKVVGVLSLDAQDDLERTGFDMKETRELMRKYAQYLTSQCFAHGMTMR